MLKIKIGIAALCVMLAASALAADVASASWFVEGEGLAAKATVALAATAKVDESVAFNVPSLGVKLTCTGGASGILSARKPFIQGSGIIGAESLIFQGCSEIAPSTCTIQTEIETNPVAASVEQGSAPLDRLHFAPTAGKAFATIEFKGLCAEAGEQPLHGQLSLNAPALQEETAAQSIQGLGTTENNSLELIKDKAYITGGKALLKLASGAAWRFGSRLAEAPESHNFGKDMVGIPETIVWRVRATLHIALGNLRVNVLEGDEDAYSILRDTCSLELLEPPDECLVEVTFDPEGLGLFEEDLSIPVSVVHGSAKETVKIELTGEGEE